MSKAMQATPPAPVAHLPNAATVAAAKAENAVGEALRAYLVSTGVAQHKVVTWLRDTLAAAGIEMDRSTVHRRMNGMPVWDREVLEQIAKILGTTVEAIMKHVPNSSGSGSADTDYVRARMKFGTEQMVQVQLSPGSTDASFEAVRTIDGTYLLYERNRAPAHVSGPRIPVVNIRGQGKIEYKVVVLEDDKGSRNSLLEELKARGINALGYSHIDELANSLQEVNPDGFIIDYLIGNKTTEALLGKIRDIYPGRPIWLVSGYVLTKGEKQPVARNDMLDLIQRLELSFVQKPVTNDLFAVEVATRLDAFKNS